MADFKFNNKEAATIGISQIWYIKKGAYGAGRKIFDMSGLRATVREAKTIVNVMALVSIVIRLVAMPNYLRVATQKRVVISVKFGNNDK
jgi:hypothetical protein